MKRKTHLITAACVAALVFCGPSLAFAASKKSASPAPAASASPAAKAAASPAKAPRAIPFRGTASAVDHSGKTFTIAGKEHSRVFKIMAETKIMKDGKEAKFTDLADNDKVTGSYWKKDDGTLETKSLNIGGKAEPAASPAPKKSKKEAAASPAPSPKK